MTPEYITAVAAIGQVVVAILQWVVFRRQTQLLAKQGETQEIVNATAARIPVTAQRAYVMLDRVVDTQTIPAPGGGVAGVLVQPSWKNFGQTPAKRVHGESKIVIREGRSVPREEDLLEVRKSVARFADGFNIAPDASLTFAPSALKVETIEQRKTDAIRVFIYGLAMYSAVFDEKVRYYSEFCLELQKTANGGHAWRAFDEYNSEGDAYRFQKIT